MYNHILYLLYWLANALVIYLANLIFPNFLELGTFKLGIFESAMFAGFWLTFFVWTMWDFLFVRGVKFDEPTMTLLYFWFINTIGVWIVARFSHFTGFGISSFIWAIIIGFLVNIFQRVAYNSVTDPRARA